MLFLFVCFSTSCIQLKCFVICSTFQYLAVYKLIHRHEYTQDEVLQTRSRIGVMSKVEYREARTRERWWVQKSSTTECWRNSSQSPSSNYSGMTDLRRLMRMRWENETRFTGAAQMFVWTPTFRSNSTESRQKKRETDEWRALPTLLYNTKKWELIQQTRRTR